MHISTLRKLQCINHYAQDSMKVRKVIPQIGLISFVIPLKISLDLLRDPLFPRGLTDSELYVPIFTNFDS